MTRQDQLTQALLDNLDKWPRRDRYITVVGELWHFRAGRAVCGFAVVTKQQWISKGRAKA